MTPVTQSFFPPIQEYMAQVQRAYDNQWLTNRGELVRELEFKLSEYLQLIYDRIIYEQGHYAISNSPLTF
jgi:dTDP-4-amino-4,6-dideoxygalactose transaminase